VGERLTAKGKKFKKFYFLFCRPMGDKMPRQIIVKAEDSESSKSLGDEITPLI
jgi:hypothetical protein